jgi:6-phosphogluconolactonase
MGSMQPRSYIALALILSSLPVVLALGGCGTSNSTIICSPAGCCGPTSQPCFAPQYLFALGLNGQIDVFPISASNGIPGSPTSTSGPANSEGMAVMNNQFLYVSNPQLPLGSSSIDAWSINLGMGALTTVPGSPFALGPLDLPAGLAVDNTAQVLYVAETARIDAFKADANGALTKVIGSPFPAELNPYLTVDPQDRFLFASDDIAPGSVLAYTIDPSTGALSAVAGSPFATIPGYVGNTRPGQIVVDSTGNFVYTVLTATNQVAAFSIVPSSGALVAVPGSPFAVGNRPLFLTTVNNFLYVANTSGATISGYTIDPASGVLTALAASPFPIVTNPLATSLDGAYLYTDGPNGLTTFSINPQSGALTQVGTPIPYGGASLLTFVQ